jgi:hypothetical protein
MLRSMIWGFASATANAVTNFTNEEGDAPAPAIRPACLLGAHAGLAAPDARRKTFATS